MKVGNIFSSTLNSNWDEFFEDILRTDAFKVERIVSVKPSLPEGQWYDQEQQEWVILLQGSAGLRFEGDDQLLVMKPGDYIQIPAHRRHRVEWTDLNQKTIWLAIHYR